MVALIVLTAVAGILLTLAIYIGWAEEKEHWATSSPPGEEGSEEHTENLTPETRKGSGEALKNEYSATARHLQEIIEEIEQNSLTSEEWEPEGEDEHDEDFELEEEYEPEDADEGYEPEDGEKPERRRGPTGAARDKLAADLKSKFESGASIGALAEETGRSYGFVHRMLSEAGVTLRGRVGKRSRQEQRRSPRRSRSVREQGEETRGLRGWAEEDSESGSS
jgi:hypothetical protein